LPEPARGLEGREVAPDRLHGDVEAACQVRAVDPASREHQLGDLGLAFFCEHGVHLTDGNDGLSLRSLEFM
jgi:hypothetical protein